MLFSDLLQIYAYLRLEIDQSPRRRLDRPPPAEPRQPRNRSLIE
jgi:hypothetical protein